MTLPNTRLTTRDVLDPIPDPKTGLRGRLVAAVNRQVDVLEFERSHDRISSGAYYEGRLLQALWEAARRPYGGSWSQQCSRVDAERSKEIAIVRALDAAVAIVDELGRLELLLGPMDAAVVMRVLGDGWSYQAVATERRRPGDRGARYYAQRFRNALELMAHRRGKKSPPGC